MVYKKNLFDLTQYYYKVAAEVGDEIRGHRRQTLDWTKLSMLLFKTKSKGFSLEMPQSEGEAKDVVGGVEDRVGMQQDTFSQMEGCNVTYVVVLTLSEDLESKLSLIFCQ